jgi:glutamate dehydrogenase
MLIELFKARFDPDGGAGAGARAAEQERAIEAALGNPFIRGRVLRRYLAALRATTLNSWRRDAAGKRRSFLSLKFDPIKCPIAQAKRCSRSSSIRRV